MVDNGEGYGVRLFLDIKLKSRGNFKYITLLGIFEIFPKLRSLKLRSKPGECLAEKNKLKVPAIGHPEESYHCSSRYFPVLLDQVIAALQTLNQTSALCDLRPYK